MRARFIDRKRRVVEVDDLVELVVMTEAGDPVSVSIENLSRVIATAHAQEKDFPRLLKQCGMRPSNVQVVTGPR